MKQFSGPLPPPDELAKYNNALPDGAERIMTMAERQQSHRINMESKVINGDSARSTLGLILGFVIVLFLGGSGVWLLYLGKDVTGLALIFTPLATLAGIFVITQRERKLEREARSGQSAPKNR